VRLAPQLFLNGSSLVPRKRLSLSELMKGEGKRTQPQNWSLDILKTIFRPRCLSGEGTPEGHWP